MSQFNALRWAMATTLARWSGNRLYRPIKALLALSVLAIFTGAGYYQGKKVGTTEGVELYHSMCYNVGGFIVDEEGRAVQCAPLTQLPKKEVEGFNKRLDNT
jgi:hypothetical protein